MAIDPRKKTRIETAARCLKEMAATFRVELGEATIKAYIGILADYDVPLLEHACRRTLREWPEPSKMPTPAFILQRIEDKQREKVADHILKRGDKPADWDPLFVLEVMNKLKKEVSGRLEPQ